MELTAGLTHIELLLIIGATVIPFMFVLAVGFTLADKIRSKSIHSVITALTSIIALGTIFGPILFVHMHTRDAIAEDLRTQASQVYGIELSKEEATQLVNSQAFFKLEKPETDFEVRQTPVTVSFGKESKELQLVARNGQYVFLETPATNPVELRRVG